jgi:phosphatidate cytidylyltransferase
VGLDPRMEQKLPGFYHLLWAWFATSTCYCYGKWLEELTNNPLVDTSGMPGLLSWFVKYQAMISLVLYGAVFVVTVLLLRPPQETYLYQVQRLTFTIVSLMVIFAQMQGAISIIYKGLFFYFVPAAIVMTNDIMAYFTGVALGRKFFDRPLLTLSPNKTFEGFLGAILWTSMFAFFFSGHVAQFKWMICPSTSLTFEAHQYHECKPHSVFEVLPPSSLPSWWPLNHDGGDAQYSSSSFSLLSKPRSIQFHMVMVSLFASLVGPFGGFIASAVKRAYDIKDFASFLPGHGKKVFFFFAFFFVKFSSSFLLFLC